MTVDFGLSRIGPLRANYPCKVPARQRPGLAETITAIFSFVGFLVAALGLTIALTKRY
ncbi:hypothetical protein ABZ565_34095 [Streptomyces sp. NPDC016469]|uniref:hypothetical protein n=1 Tax=Streptomyces sp. NPDC016469 TaxID=3157191 RepID=UPI0033C48A0A